MLSDVCHERMRSPRPAIIPTIPRAMKISCDAVGLRMACPLVALGRVLQGGKMRTRVLRKVGAG